MSVASVTWKPDEFVADVREAVAVGLTAGAEVIADEMRRNMGSEGGRPLGRTDVVAFTTRSGNGIVFKVKKRFTLYAAAPEGAFPGIRTGQLRRSIMHTNATANNLIASAGSASGKQDRYGLWLEYGTKKMAPRPWIFRSFNRAKDKAFEAMADASRAAFQRIAETRAEQ